MKTDSLKRKSEELKLKLKALIEESNGDTRALQPKVQELMEELTQECHNILEPNQQQRENFQEGDVFFQAFAHTSLEGIAISENGILCEVNEQFAKMHGYEREEVIGKPVTQFLAPEDHERVLRAVQGDEEQIGEYKGVRKDGSEIILEAHGRRIECNGRPVRMTVLRDNTERKRVEEALQESERRFRSLIENASDLIVLLDATGYIKYASPSVKRIGGYNPEDLVGRHVLELTHPDDVPTVVGAIATARAQPLVRLDFEVRIRDIEENWHTLEVAGANLLEEKAVRGFVVNARDITERKREEEALRKSEEKYRDLFMDDLTGDFICTRDGTILDCNSAFVRIFGFSSIEEVKSSSILQTYIDPCERDTVIARLQKEKRLEGFEMFRKRRDGTRIHIIENLVGIFNNAEELIQIKGYVFDDTDRVHAEEAVNRSMEDLKQSNEDLERFAYVASHDLQEPLRTITSFTQLLERRYRGRLDQDADEFFGLIVGASKRMQDLVTDLLEYSRVTSQTRPLIPTNAEEVLEGVLESLNATIDEQGAIVTHDALPMVQADAVQLRQVFQNLISNAIKFRSDAVPLIHISAVKIHDMWQFSVKDNGIGIDPQYKDTIFVIFQRLHARDQYEGTGIGLALVKRIVERHGGRIWVESEPGNGSTFFFTITTVKKF